MKFKAQMKKDWKDFYAQTPRDISDMFYKFSEEFCSEPKMWTGEVDMFGNEIYFGDKVKRICKRNDWYPAQHNTPEHPLTKEWEEAQVGDVNPVSGFRFDSEWVRDLFTREEVVANRYACKDYNYEVVADGDGANPRE